MLRAVLGGFGAQARALATRRRYQALLLLFLAAAWVTMDVYRALVVRGLPVAVVDRDNSALSRKLRTFLAATRELRVDEAPPSSLVEAERRLRHGQLAGVVLVPSGFSRALKRGRAAKLTVAVDMSNVLVGKNVNKAVAKAVGTLSAGIQLAFVKKLGERKERALGRAVPITVAENLAFNPAANYAVYVVPGLLLFFLHVLVLLLGASLYAERGTAPSFGHRVGAHLCTGAVAVGLGLVLAYGFLWRVEVAPAAALPVVVAALLALVVADLALAAALSRALPGELFPMQVTVLVAMLSLMLSGLTWPIDQFPEPLRVLARLVPFTPFAQASRSLFAHDTSLLELAPLLRELGLLAALYAGVALAATSLRAAAAALRARRAAR